MVIAVVPRLVGAVTQIMVVIMSYFPQYFAVIAHNTEIQTNIVVLVQRYPSKNCKLSRGSNLPPVWEPLGYSIEVKRLCLDIVRIFSNKRRCFNTVNLGVGWKLFYSVVEPIMLGQPGVVYP